MIRDDGDNLVSILKSSVQFQVFFFTQHNIMVQEVHKEDQTYLHINNIVVQVKKLSGVNKQFD